MKLPQVVPCEVWAAEDEDVFKEAFVGVNAPVGASAPEDVFVEDGGFEVHGVFLAISQADMDFSSGLLDALKARAEQFVLKRYLIKEQGDGCKSSLWVMAMLRHIACTHWGRKCYLDMDRLKENLPEEQTKAD